MERCLLCRLWKPVWKWLEEVDRLTGSRVRLGPLCRACWCSFQTAGERAADVEGVAGRH